MKLKVGQRQTDRHLFHLGQLPARVFIVAKILLIAHENDGNIGTKVFDFRGPFLGNVLYESRNKNTTITDSKQRLKGAVIPDWDS